MAGITKRVRAVEVHSPPRTTMAKGCRVSLPALLDIASGNIPKAEVRAVIKMAFTRSRDPFKMVSLRGIP
jgi:hypothetical protein